MLNKSSVMKMTKMVSKASSGLNPHAKSAIRLNLSTSVLDVIS